MVAGVGFYSFRFSEFGLSGVQGEACFRMSTFHESRQTSDIETVGRTVEFEIYKVSDLQISYFHISMFKV